MTRAAWPIHILLALPWAIAAVAVLILGLNDLGVGSVAFAIVLPAIGAVALLLTRRLWLVAAGVVAAVLGTAALVGIGLAYMDHSPQERAAQLAYSVLNPAAYVGLAACAVALVVGVLEHRRATAPAG